MNFTLEKSIEILERTPEVLKSMLSGVSADWTSHNEGGETWTVYDVLGHLIYGEKTDWLGRAEIILSENEDKKFRVFDRFAQFEESKGKSLADLLEEFAGLRASNVEILIGKGLTDSDFDKTGIHPAFGEVNLGQLLSTWVVHDLDHIVQVSRVMAYQFREDVGPWIEYLRVLKPVN